MTADDVDVALEWPGADGRTRTVAVRSDETVVEAAERAGIGIPYGCLTGACGTCTGRVVEPDAPVDELFDYRRSPRALKPRHEADGYVLLCIATPKRECRVLVGSSVLAELVENPWK
ncbi:2Fe-2S iron-sulfur cluster-binding protein [Natrialbaceae archaeon GCM10025810]|uniref:2Fe-2S iron-sulfur cluster-binding protein n=1 Tax=Halovalidus salilacus TaxID=3075124 RepID=UPI0036148970